MLLSDSFPHLRMKVPLTTALYFHLCIFTDIPGLTTTKNKDPVESMAQWLTCMCKCFLRWVWSPLGICSEVVQLGHVAVLSLCSWEAHTDFCRGYPSLQPHQPVNKFLFSCALSSVYCHLFSYRHSGWDELESQSFDWHFWEWIEMLDSWKIFISYLYSLVNCLVHWFIHWSRCFYIWNLQCFTYPRY